MLKTDFYAPIDPKLIKQEREKARSLRQTPWWKQKLASGICYYCNQKFDHKDLTMDHIVPIGRGGKSTHGNTVVCCKDCNSKKAHKTAAELALESLNLEK